MLVNLREPQRFLTHARCGRSSDPEQFLRQPAGDRDDLIGFQPGRRDDLGGLLVADRERHVGAHHHTVGADHLHDKSQHPRVMQDAVGIEQRQPFRRIGDSRCDLMVALEATQEERKPATPV